VSLLQQYEETFRDSTLFDERNFVARVEAIELLEPGTFGESGARLLAALEEVDERLLGRLRAEIAAGRHRGEGFWKLLGEYCGEREPDVHGYDALDVFVNRLTSFLPMPVPTRMLEAEMVDYHKTPARIVLELARWVTPEDVFVDLGAGLGQVALLVHLLTGARVRGLEIEPSFCGYASTCATMLGLSEAAEFSEGDARFANYSEGTVFFMYTPFRGELLAAVFECLRREALSRSFVLVTYGPCTIDAAGQSWLRAEEEINNEMTAFSVSL